MDAQSSYLFFNGLRVHYLHWNRESGGRPLVLLHGLASNACIWELTAPYLAQAGLEIYAPEARGHGLTDKPDAGYDFPTFRRDLAAFIQALNLERPVLVGHSWGAMEALDYAAHLLAGPYAPAGIVLVDGGTTQMDASGLTWEQMRDRLTPPRLAGTPLDELIARIRNHSGIWQPDDEALSIILANFEIDENERVTPRLSFEHHMQIVRAMWDFKTYAAFERLRCPALAIPARPAQPASTADAEYLANKERGIGIAREKINRLQVQWMEDTIHDIPLQRPAELARRIIDFLSTSASQNR